MRKAVLLSTLAGAMMVGSPASAQVVETPTGVVEFIGLDSWTIDMIRDSLAIHSPGTPLDECAVTLQQKLRFAGASVQRFSMPDQPRYTIITVVEPARAELIQFKPWRAEDGPAREHWQSGSLVFEEHGLEFQVGLTTWPLVRSGNVAGAYARVAAAKADSAVVESFWSFLRGATTVADRELALQLLRDHPGFRSRTLAAAVLSSFPDHDEAWYALVDALRDPVGPVSGTASDALRGMVRHAPRQVDWTPAAEHLRHVLNGTNLFMLHTTMEMLTATGVSPALAPDLLREGGTWCWRTSTPTGRQSAAAPMRCWCS
jgi:hypothetical protein